MDFFNQKYFYFILLAASLFLPLASSFEKKIQYHKKWTALFLSILVMMLIHIPIDVLFTKIGIWSFNKDFVSGPHIAGLPIEEWLFFVIIPFCCVFIYESVEYFLAPLRANAKNYYATLITGVTLIIFAIVCYKNIYTSVYCSLAGITMILIYLYRPVWWRRFQIMYLFALIPFVIVNGFLTGSYTAEPIVSYNANHILGIRIINIPIEDTIYCFEILVTVVAFYEYRLAKRFSIKNN